MNDTHVLDAAAEDIPALRSDLAQAPTALAKLEVAKSIQAAREMAAQPPALVGNDVAVPLEPLLVEWVPRFRSSFPPEFRTLPKRSQHLLFTTGVDLSMMQLTASATFEGQKAPGADRAASDIAKIKACEAAGYMRQRVKLAGLNILGFVFVKDGLAVTPEGAAKLAGVEAPAPAVSRVRVTKTEARDAYDSLSYSVTSYKQHHDSELLRADVPGILGPKMAALRELVARGWPADLGYSAEALLEAAQEILDRRSRLQANGLTQDMGRGEARTYLSGKGLSDDRINEILANPTSVTKSKGIGGMSDLDIPSYTMAYLNEEAVKQEESIGTSAMEAVIGGVKFLAIRQTAPSLHWTAQVAGTGEDLPQTYPTKSRMWDDLQRAARATGDRWASQFAKKPAKQGRYEETRFLVKTDMVETTVVWQNKVTNGWGRITAFETLEQAKASAASQGYDAEAIPVFTAEWDAESQRFTNAVPLAGAAQQESTTVEEQATVTPDPANSEDTGYLQSIINGTIDLLDPGIYDKLEPLFTKYTDDAEMMGMLNRAAEAYTAAAVAAAKGA